MATSSWGQIPTILPRRQWRRETNPPFRNRNFIAFYPVFVRFTLVHISCTVSTEERLVHDEWERRWKQLWHTGRRLRLKCDGTRAETRFRLSTKRTSLFKSAGASIQSTTGRRAVHINLQGLHCSCKPVFCSHVTFTGYPFHFLVSPSLLLPCVTVCHHISTGL
jgi:hypothetical protein